MMNNKVPRTGSVVYFEGIDGLTGGYIAEDTGSAIKGNKIDLYFDRKPVAQAPCFSYGVSGDIAAFH